jgi:hypothetical protein
MIDRMIIATTIADNLATSKANYEKTYYRYFAVFPSRGRHAEFLRVGQGSHRVNDDHTSNNGDAASGHADDDPNDALLTRTSIHFKKGTRETCPFYFCSANSKDRRPLQYRTRHTLKVLRAANKILAGDDRRDDPPLCL